MREEPKLALVRWIDAFANHNYYHEGTDYTPVVMEDVGWVVEEDDESIVLCRSRCLEEESYRGIASIPIVNIQEVWYYDDE